MKSMVSAILKTTVQEPNAYTQAAVIAGTAAMPWQATTPSKHCVNHYKLALEAQDRLLLCSNHKAAHSQHISCSDTCHTCMLRSWHVLRQLVSSTQTNTSRYCTKTCHQKMRCLAFATDSPPSTNGFRVLRCTSTPKHACSAVDAAPPTHEWGACDR